MVHMSNLYSCTHCNRYLIACSVFVSFDLVFAAFFTKCLEGGSNGINFFVITVVILYTYLSFFM